MKNWRKLVCLAMCIGLLVGCSDDDDDKVDVVPEPTSFKVSAYVNDLKFPLGADLDSKKNLWVSELGTGKDDGRILMITPSKNIVPFLEGLPSVVANGSIEGLSHVKVHQNKLYVMHGISGFLYVFDISNFTSSSSPQDLSKAQKIDFRTYVDSQDLVDPLNSNGYDVEVGPDGDLLVSDAGSNAIIRVKPSGDMSVFAKIPKASNGAEAVPTGVKWDGTHLYVSTLSGFPFSASEAVIYKITSSGAVSEYKKGLSLLSNLNFTVGKKVIATQLGVFGNTGFGDTSGKVVNEEGAVLAEGFGMPTDLVKIDERNFYIVNYLSGSIDKLSY